MKLQNDGIIVKILVLDDQGFNARLVKKQLENIFEKMKFIFPYNIDTFLNFSEALDSVNLEISRNVFYSLVLTDYNLDNGNTGKHFIEELKALYIERKYAAPTCFLLSGEEPTEDVIKGFDKVFQKPYQFSELS